MRLQKELDDAVAEKLIDAFERAVIASVLVQPLREGTPQVEKALRRVAELAWKDYDAAKDALRSALGSPSPAGVSQ